jgi:hypothetical protein
MRATAFIGGVDVFARGPEHAANCRRASATARGAISKRRAIMREGLARRRAARLRRASSFFKKNNGLTARAIRARECVAAAARHPCRCAKRRRYAADIIVAMRIASRNFIAAMCVSTCRASRIRACFATSDVIRACNS